MCVRVLCVLVCDILWESVGKRYISRIESSKHLRTLEWMHAAMGKAVVLAVCHCGNTHDSQQQGKHKGRLTHLQKGSLTLAMQMALFPHFMHICPELDGVIME